MCLNIFNLYIACVKYMVINSGIYSRVLNSYCGEWGNSRGVWGAVFFRYILNTTVFLKARFESRVDQYIFILYKRITRFSCKYSVILTVLWNLNMHIMYFYFNPFSVHFTFYDVPLHFNAHPDMCTCFRCARNLYYANRFCRVLPRSKSFSSKTCLMCIICTLEYVRCSNGTMNNTSTLILWYR